MKTYTCHIHEGHLYSPELQKDLKRKAVQGIKVSVGIEEYGEKQRSIQQNRYLFGAVYKPILEFYKNNLGSFMLDIMEAMKAELTTEFIHELFKMWFNKGRSTKDLSTVKFNSYFNKIREHFWHKHKLDLPEPNGVPME